MSQGDRVISSWLDLRPDTPIARALGVLALAVVGMGGLATAQRADAAPMLGAQLTQVCNNCNDPSGALNFTSGTFVSLPPAPHLNQHLFNGQTGNVRQRVLGLPPEQPFAPGPNVEVQGRAIAVPGQIGLLAESSFIAQTFDFASTSGGTLSEALASFRLDNNIVSGRVPPGTRVPVQLNLPIRARMAVEALPRDRAGFGSIGSFAKLQLDVAMAGRAHRGVLALDLHQISNGPSFPSLGMPIDGTGFFEGLEAQARIEDSVDPLTGLRLVPFVRLPVSLDLALDFDVPANLPFAIDVRGFANFTGFTLGSRDGWNHRARRGRLHRHRELPDRQPGPESSPRLQLQLRGWSGRRQPLARRRRAAPGYSDRGPGTAGVAPRRPRAHRSRAPLGEERGAHKALHDVRCPGADPLIASVGQITQDVSMAQEKPMQGMNRAVVDGVELEYEIRGDRRTGRATACLPTGSIRSRRSDDAGIFGMDPLSCGTWAATRTAHGRTAS